MTKISEFLSLVDICDQIEHSHMTNAQAELQACEAALASSIREKNLIRGLITKRELQRDSTDPAAISAAHSLQATLAPLAPSIATVTAAATGEQVSQEAVGALVSTIKSVMDQDLVTLSSVWCVLLVGVRLNVLKALAPLWPRKDALRPEVAIIDCINIANTLFETLQSSLSSFCISCGLDPAPPARALTALHSAVFTVAAATIVGYKLRADTPFHLLSLLRPAPAPAPARAFAALASLASLAKAANIGCLHTSDSYDSLHSWAMRGVVCHVSGIGIFPPAPAPEQPADATSSLFSAVGATISGLFNRSGESLRGEVTEVAGVPVCASAAWFAAALKQAAPVCTLLPHQSITEYVTPAILEASNLSSDDVSRTTSARGTGSSPANASAAVAGVQCVMGALRELPQVQQLVETTWRGILGRAIADLGQECSLAVERACRQHTEAAFNDAESSVVEMVRTVKNGALVFMNDTKAANTFVEGLFVSRFKDLDATIRKRLQIALEQF